MAKCEEVAGFLISAPCKRQAQTRCKSCNKGICINHGRPANGSTAAVDPNNPNAVPLNCISCHRKSGASYTEDNDDPYLYSGFYYNDYYDRSYSNDSWSDNRGAFDNSNQMDGNDDFGDDGDFENDFDGS